MKKLFDLFGNEADEMLIKKGEIEGVILREKFIGLVRQYNLEVFEEYGQLTLAFARDGEKLVSFVGEESSMLVAEDDTGKIMYKDILHYEWFRWEPNVDYDEENFDLAKLIFEETGGTLVEEHAREQRARELMAS
jgi:hypothetical protein